MRLAILVASLLWCENALAGEFPFVAACEEAVKERLVAPSTYRRIKLTEARERITFDELLAGEASENVKKLMRRAATREPVRMVALFEYDATNAHGVPIRLKSRCTYETASDPDFDVETARGLVKIDGKHVSGWPSEGAASFTLKRRSD